VSNAQTFELLNSTYIKNILMLSFTDSFTITSKEEGKREWIFL